MKLFNLFQTGSNIFIILLFKTRNDKILEGLFVIKNSFKIIDKKLIKHFI